MNPKSKTPEERDSEQKRKDRRSAMLDKLCEEQENLVSNSLGMMDDLHTLQETIDRLTAENNDLKDRLHVLSVNNEHAKIDTSKSNDEFKAVKSQLEAKTTALFSALSKLDAANATVSKLNAVVHQEEWRQNRSLEAAEKEQKRIQDNCNHLNDIVKTQSETIKIASEKLSAVTRNEDHLARKTINLYNDNQKLISQIADLNKQIEGLKTPSITPVPIIPPQSDNKVDSFTLRSTAALRIIGVLKKDLAEFNEKPLYKRILETPSLLEHITTLVNIGQ